MERIRRSFLTLILVIAVALASQPAAASAMADGAMAMADCPHAMAAGHPGKPGPLAPPGSLPPCCSLLPAAASGALALRLPDTAPAVRLRPVSHRLPAGAGPGPELPPPRG